MANQLTTYILAMTGITLLFYFGGIAQECVGDGLCTSTTPTSLILNMALNPQNMLDSTLYARITLLISGLGSIAAIILGFVNRNPELIGRNLIGSYLLVIGFDFLGVFQKVYQQNAVLAILIFSPLFIMYIITVVDWIGKND